MSPLVTVHTGAETIQGRKLFAEIRYKSFELVTSATCDGLKVLELYPVKLLKEIE